MCLSGEHRWNKSCSAPPIVGLLECSLLAADTMDLKFKCHSIFCRLYVYLYIIYVMYPLKCIVSEAWSSSASWQPRWVGIAPAENEILRLTRGKIMSRNPSIKYFLSRGCCCKWTCQSCFSRSLKTYKP